MTLFGIDRLLADPELRRPLEGKRIALVAHPASVTRDLTHSLDALLAAGLNVTAAFGPQHGLKGDKQDNMVESDDFTDPVHSIPVFSLYGEVRRPTGQAMGTFDVVLTGPGDKKIQVIKVVRAATGLGLKEAKALVDEAPKPVKEGIDKAEADKLKADLEEAGGTVELK